MSAEVQAAVSVILAMTSLAWGAFAGHAMANGRWIKASLCFGAAFGQVMMAFAIQL